MPTLSPISGTQHAPSNRVEHALAVGLLLATVPIAVGAAAGVLMLLLFAMKAAPPRRVRAGAASEVSLTASPSGFREA